MNYAATTLNPATVPHPQHLEASALQYSSQYSIPESPSLEMPSPVAFCPAPSFVFVNGCKYPLLDDHRFNVHAFFPHGTRLSDIGFSRPRPLVTITEGVEAGTTQQKLRPAGHYSADCPPSKKQCIVIHGLQLDTTAESLGKFFEALIPGLVVIEADVYQLPSGQCSGRGYMLCHEPHTDELMRRFKHTVMGHRGPVWLELAAWPPPRMRALVAEDGVSKLDRPRFSPQQGPVPAHGGFSQQPQHQLGGVGFNQPHHQGHFGAPLPHAAPHNAGPQPHAGAQPHHHHHHHHHNGQHVQPAPAGPHSASNGGAQPPHPSQAPDGPRGPVGPFGRGGGDSTAPERGGLGRGRGGERGGRGGVPGAFAPGAPGGPNPRCDKFVPDKAVFAVFLPDAVSRGIGATTNVLRVSNIVAQDAAKYPVLLLLLARSGGTVYVSGYARTQRVIDAHSVEVAWARDTPRAVHLGAEKLNELGERAGDVTTMHDATRVKRAMATVIVEAIDSGLGAVSNDDHLPVLPSLPSTSDGLGSSPVTALEAAVRKPGVPNFAAVVATPPTPAPVTESSTPASPSSPTGRGAGPSRGRGRGATGRGAGPTRGGSA